MILILKLLATIASSRIALEQELNSTLAMKDEEVKNLGLKMEGMALEFADMIQSIIDKLSERVEVTHTISDSKLPLMDRLEEASH